MDIHKAVGNFIDKVGRRLDDGWTYIASNHKFDILTICLFIQGILLIFSLSAIYQQNPTIVEKIFIVSTMSTLPPICFLTGIAFQVPKFHHKAFHYLSDDVNSLIFNKLASLYDYNVEFESNRIEQKVRDIIYYTRESWDVYEGGARTIYITHTANAERVLCIASKIYYWCNNIQFIPITEIDRNEMLSNDLIITTHAFNFKLEIGEDFAVIPSRTFNDSIADYRSRKGNEVNLSNQTADISW